MGNKIGHTVEDDAVAVIELFTAHGAAFAVDKDFTVLDEILCHTARFDGIGELQKALELDKFSCNGYRDLAVGDPANSDFHKSYL